MDPGNTAITNSNVHIDKWNTVLDLIGLPLTLPPLKAGARLYLMAVLKEGMRIFPIAPQGTPRASPGMIVDGHHIPPGLRFPAHKRANECSGGGISTGCILRKRRENIRDAMRMIMSSYFHH
jgi:hypothetical protein